MLANFQFKQIVHINNFPIIFFSMQGIFQKTLKVNNLEWVINFMFFECVYVGTMICFI
jgi:hypothetical protein